MASCSEIFERDGESLEVAANRPLSLDDATSVWFVASGRIEVFATPADEGMMAGGRSYLGRVEPGRVLFASDHDGAGALRLVAVGSPGTKVFRLPVARLQKMASSPDTAAQIGDLLNQWIEQLTGEVAHGSMPRVTSAPLADQDTPVKAGAVVSPTRTVWISTPQTQCRFLGKAALSFQREGDVFPLASAGWIEMTEATTLRADETHGLLGEARLWAGLQQFHQAILSCALENVEESAEQQRSRLSKKAAAEVEQTTAALSQLAAAIQPGRTQEASVPLGQDPLLAACQLVGRHLKTNIQTPSNYGETQLVDPVSAIARASGVRIRRVVLSGKWWLDDSGPLLGYRRDGDDPVALLPTSGGYDIVDPRTGTRTPLTVENRDDLIGTAYCFYRAFDARSLRPSDILRFGLFRTGRDWVTLVLLGLSSAVLGLFVPVATGLIISNVIPGEERDQLLLFVAALTVNAIVVSLFEFAQGIAVLRMEARMDSTVEAGVWDRLLNLPASFFRQYSTGDLVARAMGIGQIRQVITQAAMSSLLTFVFSLVTFALLFYYDVRLAIVAMLIFVVVVAATCLAAWLQLPIERMQYQVRGKVAGLVLQLLTGISRLRVAGAENRALAYWARNYSQQVQLTYQSQMVSNGLATFLAAVPVLSTMVIFVAVAWFPSGDLSLAGFLAFSAAYAQVMSAAISVGTTVSSIIDIVPLYERSKPILETLPESVSAKGDPGTLSGRIEITHASFRYHPDGPLVLDDVSMDIRPGEFVAFVGPSGAGKSTILRLLLGFEAPEKGSIYFDHVDFAQLDRQAVRRQIGVVFQNSRLVSGDIFRNIVGSAPLTLDDAWEAARLSGLDDDINRMPMGMHTVISEGESTLSGGQRQRLLIARAVVTRPKMLFFDEATSALDNVTQAKVAKSLESLKTTRVVVAHRLSTIMNADRIFVIQGGKIVQQGKYDELLAQPGLFADLAKRQII
jgi:NHLM bacteriocin system ABC transporter ATP-binding protein